MDRFSLRAPRFDRVTVEALRALAKREGKTLAHFAAYGFPAGVRLDCSRSRARLACCWDAVEADRANGLALLELGHCYRSEVFDDADAERVYREVERVGRPGLHPGVHDEDPLFFLAWLYADSDRLEDALELYERVIERLAPDNEGHALVHYHMGSVFHEAEFWIEASEEYDLAAAAIGRPGQVLAPAADLSVDATSSPPEPTGAEPQPKDSADVSSNSSGTGGAAVRPDDAFERFFGLHSLREVARQRQRTERCLTFDGARACQISRGVGLYTPPLWP